MSKPEPDTTTDDDPSTADDLQRFADAFDLDADPLAKFDARFRDLEASGLDPFEAFIERGVSSDREETIDYYRRTFRYWRGVMADTGRHPACPHEGHVRDFVRYLRDERGNQPTTVGQHLTNLNTAYQFWQRKAQFPHPANYNPITEGRKSVDLDYSNTEKNYPPLSLADLRDIVADIRHVRDRAVVVTQLKLGLRAGELCNLRLADVTIDNRELQTHFPSMGTADPLRDYDNALYVPADRDGNKSERPRILPLDNDMKRVLIDYLLIRPDFGQPWVFLSKQNHSQLDRSTPTKQVWNPILPDEYTDPDDEQYDPVTSHYGRHRMSSWLKIEKGISPEYVKYLRGDKVGTTPGANGGLEHYLHVKAADVRDVYLDNIYALLR